MLQNLRVLLVTAVTLLVAIPAAFAAAAHVATPAPGFWDHVENVSLEAATTDCQIPGLHAASEPTDLADARVPVVCPGIRPGAQMVSPSGCTLAWILRDAAGNLYASTAGHCVGAAGTPVRVAVDNVPAGIASPDETVEIGNVFYVKNNGEGHDFAVIKIHDHLKNDVNPQLCHWGGPTGLYTGGGALGDVVRQYGHGVAIGAAAESRARSGLAAYFSDVGYGYYGAVTNGDSGSPVMTAEGEALGVLNTLGTKFSFSTNTDDLIVQVGGAGTRLTQGMSLVKAATGVELELVTAPLL